MQETGPLARHRIFITARKIEYPVDERRKISLNRHETMIAIDHYPWSFWPREVRQPFEIGQNSTGIEKHMAGKDQVKLTGAGGFQQGAGGYRFEQHFSGLYPARHLPAKAVKLPVGGQHPDRAHRQGGYQPDQKIMGVWRKAEGRRIRQMELISDMLLRVRPDRTHDPVPFVICQPSGVVPGRHMTGMAGVRPKVMAVGRKMETLRLSLQRSGKQMFPAHSWVRSDQSSGKARLPIVLCR